MKLKAVLRIKSASMFVSLAKPKVSENSDFFKNYKKLKQLRRIVNEDENHFLDDSSNVIESYVPS